MKTILRARSTLLLLGHAASPRWSSPAAEATAPTVSVDRRSSRWRALATLLAGIDEDAVCVAIVTDADTTFTASGRRERRDDSTASSVKRGEFEESTGFRAHNLDFLDGAKPLRQDVPQSSLGDILDDTLQQHGSVHETNQCVHEHTLTKHCAVLTWEAAT